MRALAWFWAIVILLAGAGAGFLQWHGPPAPRTPDPAIVAGRDHAPVGPVVAGSAVVAAEPVAPTTLVAGPPLGTPIAPADPALLEPSRDFADGFLPRIGADGRTPAQAYAAAADPSERRPMVAILLAGIGMSATDSDQAIMGAPTAVSLAVSPYTVQPDPLLAEARQHGHEFFLSIPMEPRGYPLDDPGNRALLTGNTTAANAQQLEWAMTRFTGYVGATGALGELHGERFADSSGQLEPVLEELSRRGVLYIDPRPGATLPPGIAGRAVDVLIDEIPGASDIDAHLGRLEQIALTRGSALGLVSVPRPVALERLEAWASGLRHRGVALVPVSAITRVLPRAEKAGP